MILFDFFHKHFQPRPVVMIVRGLMAVSILLMGRGKHKSVGCSGFDSQSGHNNEF